MKGVPMTFFSLFSIKAVKCHPGSARTPPQTRQLCSYQTMTLCLWNLIGKSHVTLNRGEMSHAFKQVFPLCTFLPLFLQKDTEKKLALYFGWGRRKSFSKQGSAPLKDDRRDGSFSASPLLTGSETVGDNHREAWTKRGAFLSAGLLSSSN